MADGSPDLTTPVDLRLVPKSDATQRALASVLPSGTATVHASRSSQVALGALGFALGTSALWAGFYDISAWGALTLAVLVGLIGVAVSRSIELPAPTWVALSALAALACWALASVAWAESSASATEEAHRWALAAALALLVALLIHDGDLGGLPGRAKRATVLLGGITAGVLGVAVLVTATLLLGDAPEMFLAGRLVEPLGYANGQAAHLLLAVWPLLVVAERTRGFRAAAAAGCAAWVVALATMSQSRGATVAFVAVVLLMLVVLPGRARRVSLVLTVLVALVATLPFLLDVLEGGSPARMGDLRWAGALALLAGVLATGLWGGACAMVENISRRDARVRRRVYRAYGSLLAVLALGAVTTLALRVGSPVDEVRERVTEFTALEQPVGRDRLLSSGGNRYDYWRVAIVEWRRKPVLGVGAGNYTTHYFRERRTSEDVRQPHSLELQVLAELGVVGAFLLAVVLLTPVVAMLRAVRRSPESGLAVLAAASGLQLTWLAHTSLDWLHLLPGVAGAAWAALAAVSVLAGGKGRGPRNPTGRFVLTAAVVLLAAATASGVARLATSDALLDRARATVRLDPRRALAAADDSLALRAQALDAIYVKAAAHARLGDAQGAERALLLATTYERSNPVPFALLGDLAVRRGRFGEAGRYYGRAAALNPRDPLLAALARDPRSVQEGR